MIHGKILLGGSYLFLPALGRSVAKLLAGLFFLAAVGATAGPTTNTVSVPLTWNYDFINNPGVTNFTVFYGNGSAPPGWTGTNVTCGCYQVQVNTGLSTNFTTTLPRGFTYFFAVTATDTNGLMSDFSNEVTTNLVAKPSPPTSNRFK